MKNKTLLLLIFVLISVTANAGHYFPVDLIYIDGKVQTGYAKWPVYGPRNCIVFKTARNTKKQKIPADSLKTIIYLNDIQYDRMRIYRGLRVNKLSKRYIKRGQLTVYTNDFTGIHWHLYFHRTGEDGATLVFTSDEIRRVSVSFEDLGQKYYPQCPASKNLHLLYATPVLFFTRRFKDYRRPSAQRYFKDTPELSAKIIKNKIYNWNDIEEIVERYNRRYQRTN